MAIFASAFYVLTVAFAFVHVADSEAIVGPSDGQMNAAVSDDLSSLPFEQYRKADDFNKSQAPISHFRQKLLPVEGWLKEAFQMIPNGVLNFAKVHLPSRWFLFVYSIVTTVLTVSLIVLGIYCRTGLGCCCFAWFWRYPWCFCCDLKRTNRKLRLELLRAVPGFRYRTDDDDDGVVIEPTGEPSVAQLRAFIEAVGNIRSLQSV